MPAPGSRQPVSASLRTFAAASTVILLLSACFTDAATRLAHDIEDGAAKVGPNEGARYTVVHRVPSKRAECEGPYRVQFDRVGAIIIWCKDASGDKTGSSHSTTAHGRYAEIVDTRIVDKPTGETLLVDLQRRSGRVVIVDVR